MDSSASGGRARATLLFFTFPRGEERERKSAAVGLYWGWCGRAAQGGNEVGRCAARQIDRAPRAESALPPLSLFFSCVYVRARPESPGPGNGEKERM